MSAYIVDETDIAAIAKIAAYKAGWRTIGGRIVNMVKREIHEFDAPEIAKILAMQNVVSVEYRYPNHGEAGGFLNRRFRGRICDVDDEIKPLPVGFAIEGNVEGREAQTGLGISPRRKANGKGLA